MTTSTAALGYLLAFAFGMLVTAILMCEPLMYNLGKLKERISRRLKP